MKLTTIIHNLRDRISAFMREWVATQNEGSSVFELYASFWFWIGLVGGSILMVVGAAFDSLIVWGIAFGVTGSTWISVVIALIICFLIQIFLGTSTVLSVLAFLRGKHRERGYRTMIVFTSLLALVSLVSTLYLSRQSREVVEVVKERPTLADLDVMHSAWQTDMAIISQPYDVQIAQLSAQIEHIKNQTDERSKILAAAGRTTDAAWSRHQGMAQARRATEALSKVAAKKADVLNQNLADYQARRDQVALDNAATLKEHHGNVSYWGMVVKYSNFLINFLRFIIVAMLTKWVVSVKDELHAAARKVEPQRILVSWPPRSEKQPETVVAQASQQDGSGKAETVSETTGTTTVYVDTDISRLKKYTITYYKRSLNSAGGGTRARNREQFEHLKKQLAERGIQVIVQPDKILTFK